MQRHRQDHIDAIYIPKKHKCRQEKFAKGIRQLYFAPVFKAVDNFGGDIIVFQGCPGDAELVAGCQTGTAKVVLSPSAGKWDTAAIAKRGFNRDQTSEASGTQAAGQGYFRLGSQ